MAIASVFEATIRCSSNPQENAALPQGMAFPDCVKVGIITRAVVGVAQPAKGLQVVRIVGTPVFARPLEGVVAEPAGNLVEADRPVFPDRRPAFGFVDSY